jgi:hypothetical protein
MGTELTLEQEFETFKAIHKYAVVKAKAMKYYSDLRQDQINLPDFMDENSPEELADRDIRNFLTHNSIQAFNNVYEKAWLDIRNYVD